MSRAQIDVILAEHDHAWRRVQNAVRDLTEEEYRWAPVAGALTLADVYPQPAEGFSTVEWKLAHLAGWKMRYANFLFGDRTHTFDAVMKCDTLDKMLSYLEQARDTMRRGIEALTDEILTDERPTGWSGDAAIRPIFPTIGWMIQHDVYHAGQIRTVRGLYRLLGARGT